MTIAEGPTLAALIDVTKAYSAADAPSLLGRMLRTARWPVTLAAALSLLATVFALARHSEFGIQMSAIATVACIYLFRRDAFREHFARRSSARFLDEFSPRDHAFRYIVFKENVSQGTANDAGILERVLRLLEQRQRVRSAGTIARHPLVATLCALFLMLLGALVSKLAEASATGTAMALFFIGMMTLLAMQFGAVWRTREYRDEELAEFVLWLWAEAGEREAAEGGGVAK